jgi:hypothetical protein
MQLKNEEKELELMERRERLRQITSKILEVLAKYFITTYSSLCFLSFGRIILTG